MDRLSLTSNIVDRQRVKIFSLQEELSRKQSTNNKLGEIIEKMMKAPKEFEKVEKFRMQRWMQQRYRYGDVEVGGELKSLTEVQPSYASKANRPEIKRWNKIVENLNIAYQDGRKRWRAIKNSSEADFLIDGYFDEKVKIIGEVMNEDHGYIDSNPTNGGENLTEDDKEEITEELEEIFK